MDIFNFTLNVTDDGLTIVNNKTNECVQIKKIEKGSSYFNSRIIRTQDGQIKINYDESGFKISFIKDENTLLRSLGIPNRRSDFRLKFDTLQKIAELGARLPDSMGGKYVPLPNTMRVTAQQQIERRINKVVEGGIYF